jgi:hypothetical protein
MRSAIGKWLTHYVTPAVAIGSLFASAMAVYISKQTQGIDFEYREALIRPRLNWGTSGTNFSVYVNSAGLGPAAIKGFGMRVDGKCSDISTIPQGSWAVESRNIHNAILDAVMNVFDSLPPPKTKKPFPLQYLAYSTNILDVGQVLKPETVFVLFSFDEKSSKEIERYIRENYGSDGINDTFFRFTNGMRDLGLSVRYCSITDRFCESNALGENGC